MRKCVVLLALVMVLLACAAGCGTPWEEWEVFEPTFGPPPATVYEPPSALTEHEFVSAGGESNGVRWRTLDLEDKANADMRTWFHRNRVVWRSSWSEASREYPIGNDGKTITIKRDRDYNYYFVLQEEGKKDKLVHQTDDYEYGLNILGVLDERYFVFRRQYDWGYSREYIVDMKKQREIPIGDNLGYLGHDGTYAYFTQGEGGEMAEPGFALRPYKYDWTVLREGGDLQAERGFDFIPDIVVEGGQFLTEDARYYVIFPDDSGRDLYVFDMQKGEELLHTTLDIECFLVRQLDDHTLYGFDHHFEPYEWTSALEIKLP